MEHDSFRSWIETKYAKSFRFVLGRGDANSCKINYNVRKSKDRLKETADYAIKYYPEKYVMIVWNMKRRRNHNGTENFTLNKSWDEISPNQYTAISHYCTYIGDDKQHYWDKVLVIGEYFFKDFFDNHVYWSALNSNDCIGDAQCFKELFEDEIIWPSETERKKYSTIQKQRDAKFRQAVLNEYNTQCAVCRCSVEPILQAAHLRTHEVAITTLDEDVPQNGICLCANHHIMYERSLIDLDLLNSKLIIRDDQIKSMPWYTEFVEKYNGKIVKRNIRNK